MCVFRLVFCECAAGSTLAVSFPPFWVKLGPSSSIPVQPRQRTTKRKRRQPKKLKKSQTRTRPRNPETTNGSNQRSPKEKKQKEANPETKPTKIPPPLFRGPLRAAFGCLPRGRGLGGFAQRALRARHAPRSQNSNNTALQELRSTPYLAELEAIPIRNSF